MHRLVFLILLCIVPCQFLEASDSAVENPRRKTVALDRETFLSRVFDYTRESSWKYLGEKPCIIDFYADWCPPCHVIAPVLESLAREFEGEIIIYKVDVDADREVAETLGIREYPTLLFVPVEGRPKLSKGAQNKRFYRSLIEEFLLEDSN